MKATHEDAEAIRRRQKPAPYFINHSPRGLGSIT